MRLVSSKDHGMSRDELIKTIESTGSDRYDNARPQQFNDFYDKHDVHFFAELVTADSLERELSRMVREFPAKTKGDRGRAVIPDIAIIYDADKCEMITNVYDELDTSDCYRFSGKPIDALKEVRAL